MILLALAAAALVPPGKGPVQVYGYPDIDSCGVWTDQRRDPKYGSQVNAGWILGFVSGLNRFGDGNGDIAPGVRPEGLLAWVDQYCASHPLDSVTVAGLALAKELKRRSVR